MLQYLSAIRAQEIPYPVPRNLPQIRNFSQEIGIETKLMLNRTCETIHAPPKVLERRSQVTLLVRNVQGCFARVSLLTFIF